MRKKMESGEIGSSKGESVTERLKSIRIQIDEIDSKLLDLLNQRAGLCKEVGRIKSMTQESVFKPFREKEVLTRLIRENPGVLPEDHLRAIYREILSSSRTLQQPQTVLYLGPEGTFSYFAGVEYLGRSSEFNPCVSVREVFSKVVAKEAALGIIPIENSLQGSVGQCLDMFLEYEIFIQAEMFCKISHALLSKEGSLADIQTVFSHPQALDQCAQWLRSHLPRCILSPLESTAAAARRVVDTPKSAAIGHIHLSQMYGLNVLSPHIEDLNDNWTRFIIIGASPASGGNQDKTSLIFTLPDKSGALVQVLTLLAQSGINMKKLESRPIRSERWSYVFFADVECDLSSEKYEKLKQDLSEKCRSLRILGSYPSGPKLFNM